MVRVTVSDIEAVTVDITLPAAYVSVGSDIATVQPNPYVGETTITPTTETQVLQTMNTSVSTNITIEPIPSNYGLITWNGSNLMIS